MASNIEEDSLYEALNYLRLAEMPDEYDPESGNIWAKSIVRVQKRDTSINYAIALNDGRGGYKIIKDFGRISQIVKVLNNYPLAFLEKRDMPSFRKQSEFIEFLKNHGYDEKECRALISRKDEEGNNKPEDKLKSDRDEIRARIREICIKIKIKG